MKRLLSFLLIASLVVGALLVGCDERSQTTQQQEAARTERNQRTLLENQPPISLEYSLERENINKRTLRFNDPNKISWLYLLSDTGQIYTFLPIKGKVSSVNSWVTTPEQIICPRAESCVTVESPSEDGSYGSNGDAIFWFDANDVYGEWNGKYLLFDEPLQLTSQPLMIYDASKE